MLDTIVLAGGLGTRLRAVVQDCPKPLAPVANRPFLEYLFDYLISQSICDRCILSVGYEYQKIIDHFADRYKSLPLIYSIEYTSLGTGGGIQLALSQAKSSVVLVTNGDTLFHVDLAAMLNFHEQQGADLTLALRPLENFERYNNVIREETGRLLRFEEKQFKERGLINGGIYLINKNLLAQFNLPEKFSFEEDFLKPYLDKMQVYGFVSSAYFIDIGIPADYQRSQSELPTLFST
jgi:D-glycero-alpha-D-manno-heptose 1-phosphate guanylyltransferase